MKPILSIFIFACLFVGQLSYASGTTLLQVGEELAVKTTTAMKKDGKNIVIQLVRKNGSVAQTILVPPTPKSTLKNYLPSVVSKKMKAEQGKLAATGAFVKTVMAQKLLRFPVETTGFFAALGATMTYELIFNYAQNPVAYEQLIQSQLDPVGQLGFYFFMVGNGIAAEPLMKMIHQGKLNRKFAHFIPFFGMGVGSVASNIVHELGHAPNMWACARGLLTGKGLVNKACDEAANTWHARGGVAGIAQEWAPTLVALSGSVVLSGAAKSGLTVAGKGTMAVLPIIRNGVVHVSVKVFGKAALRTVIAMSAMTIVASVMPGKIYVQGFLKVATFVSELALFTWIDEVTRRPIIFAYQNLANAGWLRRTHDTIENETSKLNKSNWKNVVTQGYVDDLRAFGKVMSSWRQHNLANVLESHGNWEQALSKISNTYHSSEIFYSSFIDHLWQKKYGRYSSAYQNGSEIRITDQIFPLYGIKTTALNVKAETLYMSAPDAIEESQLVTVENVLTAIENGKLFAGKNLSALSDSQKQKFNATLSLMASMDPVKIGKAILKMNTEIAADGNAKALSYCGKDCVIGNGLQRRYILITKSLGNPRPIFVPGLGYANYYQLAEEYAEDLKKTEYKKTWGGLKDSHRVQTPLFVESMIASMFMGPNPAKRESSIGLQKGYSALFNPPQIIKNDSLDFMITEQMALSRGSGSASMSVFNSEIGIKGTGRKSYNSAYDYIINGGISETILNSDQTAFAKWWNGRIEPQYVRAWVGFESQYQQNIAKLMQAMNAGQSGFNREGFLWHKKTDVPNGILASFNFENDRYQAILSGLASSMAMSQYAQMKVVIDQKQVKAPFWKQNQLPKNPWDFQAFALSQTEILKIVKPSPQFTAAMVWSGQLNKSLNKLNKLLSGIKAAYNVKKDAPKRILPISYVDNDEIKATADSANAALKEAAAFLSISKGHKTPLNLRNSQKILARIAIEGLMKNVNEISNYALVANSVSYRLRHADKTWKNPRCDNLMTQKKALGVNFIQKVAGCE